MLSSVQSSELNLSRQYAWHKIPMLSVSDTDDTRNIVISDSLFNIKHNTYEQMLKQIYAD